MASSGPGLLQEGRTHTCAQLRGSDDGSRVVLFGWVHRRRDHGGRIFIDLRDRDGLTQIVFGPDIDEAAHAAGESLRSEFCIGIAGKVVGRGDNSNANMATGDIEVEVDRLEVFSAAETPPFAISDDERLEAGENLRLKYRYLDLRRPSFQRNFATRARIGYVTRRALSDLGFYELETPYMVKYTPGGARNFLVPSRLHPGSFYALAESPQIYKQLFMVSGFDKYFQITRCFRDEDLRNDRQPEFTQIDLEMSFATPERVAEPIESLMAQLFDDVLGVQLETPFLRLTWQEAMDRFGSDKPDMRFGLELQDATEATRDCGFRVFDAAECVKALVVPAEHAATLGRSQLDKLTDFVKKRENGSAKGLAWVRIKDGKWEAPFAKNVGAEAQAKITAAIGASEGELALFIADGWETTHTVLCNLRLHLRDKLSLLPQDGAKQWKFLWVTDFPLFEKTDDGWASSHHPFTSPRPEHLDLMLSDPGAVRAQAYDIVLNGNEIGGGSIRIHAPDVQAKVFRALGLSDEDARAKFGFLLEAFKYGPPPHGGIALGLDRIAMLMCGASSLRDVIAFPKTQRGQDLMTGCPTPADDPQLAELYLRHRPLPGTEDGAGETSG